MSENFVPEMHDIGKLINNDAIQAALDIPLVVELADLDVARDRLGTPDAPDEEVAQAILDHYTFDGHLLAFRPEEEKEFEKDIPVRLPGPETLTYRSLRAHHDAVGDDTVIADYPLPADAGKLKLFLLILADHLASSVSRATRLEIGMGRARWEVNVLWRGRGPEPKGTVTTIEGLRDMLKFIAAAPSAEDFLKKYGSPLRDIPEAKQAPRDATSLYTHIRLVSQFYRVLEASLESAPGELPPRYFGESVESWADAEGKGSEAGKWPYRLLWYRIRFPQALVRARDLNVFILREHCLKSILRRWPDNVLLYTSDSLTLFLPRDLPSSEVLHPLLAEGFFVDGVELIGDLGSLSAERLEEQWLSKREQALELEAQREQIRKERRRRYAEAAKKGVLQDSDQKEAFERDVIQPLRERENEGAEQIKRLRGELGEPYERVIAAGPYSVYHQAIAKAETFAPPICELCQLRPGTYRWIPTQRLPLQPDQEADQPVEYLCEQCFTIRQMGYPAKEGWPQGRMFHRLERWSEADLPVAWVRVSLDHEALGRVIARLFSEHVDRELAEEDEDFREAAKGGLRSLPLKADFVADYRLLLLDFRKQLRELFESERREEVADMAEYSELYVLQVRSGKEVLKIVSAFEETFGKFFPTCRYDSPIKLAISIAAAKHPYIEHWRFLDSPKEAVNIQRVGRASLSVSFEKWRHLETIQLHQRRVSSFLHNLARIEAVTGSRILTQAAFMEQKRRLPDLINLYTLGGIEVGTILAYYKIMRD
jgi:hypothetical protein